MQRLLCMVIGCVGFELEKHRRKSTNTLVHMWQHIDAFTELVADKIITF